jgi:hypothetical protein
MAKAETLSSITRSEGRLQNAQVCAGFFVAEVSMFAVCHSHGFIAARKVVSLSMGSLPA